MIILQPTDLSQQVLWIDMSKVILMQAQGPQLKQTMILVPDGLVYYVVESPEVIWERWQKHLRLG